MGVLASRVFECCHSVIPFVFIWKGDKIRATSKFCQCLLKREQENEARERRGTKEGLHLEVEEMRELRGEKAISMTRCRTSYCGQLGVATLLPCFHSLH